MYEQKIIPADEEAFRSALSGYSAGTTSLPELLNYATTIYRDKTTLTNLQLAYAASVYESERYISDGHVYLTNTNE